MKAVEQGDYFFASRKFSEAEILLPQSEWASKSALMTGYCFYSINFYEDAILNLDKIDFLQPKSKIFKLWISFFLYLLIKSNLNLEFTNWLLKNLSKSSLP